MSEPRLRRSAASHALALAPALVLGAVLFAPALRLFFAADDVTFLSRATGLEPTPWSLARLLSGPLAWQALHGAFGLDPLPYHATRLLLHLAATALVYAVGLRLLESRVAAGAAAVLFAVSSIAFTPLHWASSLGELMMTVFALAAFEAFLAVRAHESATLPWLAAALGLGAMLSKEAAILLPLPLAVAAWRGALAPGGRAARRTLRATLPLAVVALVFGSGFIVTLDRASYLGGAAYAMSLSPAFLAQNLATYLRWCVSLHVPIRDAVAAVEPGALPAGLAIAVALAALLRWQRRQPSHAEEIGAVWFLALLLPVMPLTGHTYLYYLYAPWAGACWLIASAGRHVARRWPSPLVGALLALGLIAYVGAEFRNVRAREAASANGLPLDRTIRESLLLGNGVAGLRAAGLAAPDSIAFVNPFPTRHQNIASRDTTLHEAPTGDASYTPFEAVLRGGESVRLFFPGVRLLGFGESVPPAWEAARIFLYGNDGTLTPLGRGLESQRRLGELCVEIRRWDLAESSFRRAIALGDTSADAAHRLLLASAGMRRGLETRRLAEAFARKWPHDPRSATVVEVLRRTTR